jgi:hypothetical protein
MQTKVATCGRFGAALSTDPFYISRHRTSALQLAAYDQLATESTLAAAKSKPASSI